MFIRHSFNACLILFSIILFGCWSSEISLQSESELKGDAGQEECPNADRKAGDGPATGRGPTIGGCQIFPDDNPWNRDVSTDPIDPNSAKYIAAMAPTTGLHPDWGITSPDWYGIPFVVVPQTQPLVPVIFDMYGHESDPGPYPFPANAPIEGRPGDTVGDRHVLVLQSGSCMLYEVWLGRKDAVGSGWTAANGAVFDLKSNKPRPERWTSADAAGLPILPGLVRYDEVAAGEIKHAMRFTMVNTQRTYIHPATHWASSKTSPDLPPMGIRLRLRASFDLSGYTPAAKVIMTAFKRHGIILADNGSNWFVTGDRNDGWKPLMDSLVPEFRKIKGSDFEVVKIDEIYKP